MSAMDLLVVGERLHLRGVDVDADHAPSSAMHAACTAPRYPQPITEICMN
ncbi:hypothetical protein [Georgenia sp. SUBG003]